VIAAALLLAAAVPAVTIDSGPLVGARGSDGRTVFRGIPYAAPPVGPLRWRAPAALARWTTPREATRSAPGCPQVDYGWNHTAAAPQSEDCLYLDVATPALAAGKPLPVMVWIHGGGNRAGGGAGTIDSAIVRRGVVLVSIQYRLGALGFLSHPALSAEGGSASGNYALMDQIAALRWVRRNIARFGGDARNVTIFGESAGAQDIGLLQLAPDAVGLFDKAIEESGTAGFGLPPRSLAQNEAVGAAIASAAGAPANATAAQLRALPASALVRASEAAHVPDLGDDSYIWLQAVVDGRVLREAPSSTLTRGGGARVPLIIGSNARELTMGSSVDRMIASGFGANAAAARRFYGLGGATPPVADPRLGDLATQVADDITFRCPAAVVAKARARAGAPVWRYDFDYQTPGKDSVTHGSEIAYVLGDAAAAPGAPDLAAAWVRFASTGDPNGPGLPAWPRFTPTSSAFLRFSQTSSVAGTDLRAGLCGLRDRP
jgi:para-nitrobenzyl esterase